MLLDVKSEIFALNTTVLFGKRTFHKGCNLLVFLFLHVEANPLVRSAEFGLVREGRRASLGDRPQTESDRKPLASEE